MTGPGAALITGASKRIGAAIAADLASAGHPVAIHYNSSRHEADALVTAIRDAGGHAVALAADLADHDQVLGLVPRAAEQLDQPLLVLVNNASLFENDRLARATGTSFDQHMAINLRAPLFLSQQFAAQCPENRVGNIINLIDMRVWKPAPGFVSYTLSKAGLEMLTKTLAMDLAPGIRVNAIGPGPVLANERQSDAQFQRQWRSTLLQRGAEPAEIAALVRYIISAQALTGQMIALDGGQHLPWPPLKAENADLDG